MEKDPPNASKRELLHTVNWSSRVGSIGLHLVMGRPEGNQQNVAPCQDVINFTAVKVMTGYV